MFRTTSKKLTALILSLVIMISLFPLAHADDEEAFGADVYAAENAVTWEAPASASAPAPAPAAEPAPATEPAPAAEPAPAPEAAAPEPAPAAEPAPAPEAPSAEAPEGATEGTPAQALDAPSAEAPEGATEGTPEAIPEAAPAETPAEEPQPGEIPDEEPGCEAPDGNPIEDAPIMEAVGEDVFTEAHNEEPAAEPFEEKPEGDGPEDTSTTEETDTDCGSPERMAPTDTAPEAVMPPKTKPPCDPDEDRRNQGLLCQANIEKGLALLSNTFPGGNLILHYIKGKAGKPSDPKEIVEDAGMLAIKTIADILFPGGGSLVSVVTDIFKKIPSPFPEPPKIDPIVPPDNLPC